MASLTINIPDEHLPRILNAFAGEYGWRSTELDGTKTEFARKQIRAFIKRTVRSQEIATAVEAASQAAAAQADGIVLS